MKYGLATIRNHPLTWGCLLLATVTLLNNWPVAFFDFAWDDYGYIVRNFPIQDPISLKSISWCLTAFAEANWHPATWLLLHVEFQFFGLKPFGYHIVNLVLHLANVLLLFGVLRRLTGATGKSLAVAALFAVHPLHVESVAWISEIKDVLSTFFLLLTLHAYAGYAKRPGPGRYLLVLLGLALGLASKPMLVTAPFVLLLLDAWPLGRWTRGPLPARPGMTYPRYGTGRLLWEKVPLLLLVAATCVLTFLAQRDGGAVAGLGGLPISFRLANAAHSYVLYVWRLLWPWPLSFFYPLGKLSLVRAILCGIGLIAASAAMYLLRRQLPYLLVGWLWFLGTLVPVIGLIQVGSQAFADRYTYIPSIGLFVAGIWLADELRKRLGVSLLLPAVLTSAVIFSYMLVSFAYLGQWANEEELYRAALTLNDNNVIAHSNYGLLLLKMKKFDEAELHYKKAIAYSRNSAISLNNMAQLKFAQGRKNEAIYYSKKSIDLHPTDANSYRVLAKIKISQDKYTEAKCLLEKSLTLAPEDINALNTLGEVLIYINREEDALKIFKRGTAIAFTNDPVKSFMLNNIGVIQLRKGNRSEAESNFREATRLQPGLLVARLNLIRVLLASHDLDSAQTQIAATLALTPDNPVVLSLSGDIALARKQYAKAYVRYRRAICLNPDLADAHAGLAKVLRIIGKADAADIQDAAATELRLHPHLPSVIRPEVSLH